MLRSSVRLIYTFSRDTLSLIEDWKQKSRAELKKSASLIGTTGLISPAPSDWGKLQQWYRHKPGCSPAEQDGSERYLQCLPVALPFCTQKPNAESTSHLTQRPHKLVGFESQS